MGPRIRARTRGSGRFENHPYRERGEREEEAAPDNEIPRFYLAALGMTRC